jgi:hypothetical protein
VSPTTTGNLSASIEEIDCTPSAVIDLCDSDEEETQVPLPEGNRPVVSPVKHKLVEFLMAVLPFLFHTVPNDTVLPDTTKHAALRVRMESPCPFLS